jgi:hypothetical protein
VDDFLVSSFFQWVALYNNIATNIMGDDREDMLAVWDDDDQFDMWLKKLDATQRAKRKPGGKPGQEKVGITNEEYLKKYAKIYGGEGAT